VDSRSQLYTNNPHLSAPSLNQIPSLPPLAGHLIALDRHITRLAHVQAWRATKINDISAFERSSQEGSKQMSSAQQGCG